MWSGDIMEGTPVFSGVSIRPLMRCVQCRGGHGWVRFLLFGGDTVDLPCHEPCMAALTDIPTDELKKLLRHVHRGELPCPITADTLACVGLQFRGEPILAALRGLEEPGVRAVLVCVLAERQHGGS